MIKAVDLIIKTCISQSHILSSFNKESLTSSITDSILSLQKTQLKKLAEKLTEFQSKSLGNLEEKIYCDFNIIKKKIKDTTEEANKETQDLKTKFTNHVKIQSYDVTNLKELIQTTKETLKIEIISKYLKPEIEAMKLEFTEISRTLNAVEKQLRIVSHKLDHSVDDINAVLKSQRVNIAKWENDTNTQSPRFDSLVDTKTEKLCKTVENLFSDIEKSFLRFENIREQFFAEISEKDRSLKEYFEGKMNEISQNGEDMRNLLKKVQSSHDDLFEKFSDLEKAFVFETERNNLNMEGFTIKCYQEAKEKLIQTYKEDIKMIKKKLE